MQKVTLAIGIIAILFATTATQSLALEPTDAKLDWQFTEEQLRLFLPPMDATIAEMREWADRLHRPRPDTPEKWDEFEKYQERAALLRIDIARQIIASKPDDDHVLSSAWQMQSWGYVALARQKRTNMPLLESFYEKLKQQSDLRGRKFDQFTAVLMHIRGIVIREFLWLDGNEKYLSLGEELLEEYDAFLADKPLGKHVEQFYADKNRLLVTLSRHEARYLPNHEKFQSTSRAFREEMREILDTRENELETAYLYFAYFIYGSLAPFAATPEGQAEQRALIERIARRIAATEDAHDRFMFYQVKEEVLWDLLENNAAMEAELLVFAQELKAQFAKDGKVPYSHGVYRACYLNMIYRVYVQLFYRELDRLVESDVITDEALSNIFASARHLLYVGHPPGVHAGIGFHFFAGAADALFARLTPKQQAFHIKAFTELLAETEKIEKEWIAAGKLMRNETELTPLRDHLARLQLPGKAAAFTGTTLDSEMFDLENLRGKIVLLNFWATWCGPCITKLPGVEELYKKYHSSGFEVVGISIDADNTKERVVELVESRQLPWIQLHDPAMKLFRQFHGQGVPHCLLIDREGRVIMLNARGEALTRKLAELFAGR